MAIEPEHKCACGNQALVVGGVDHKQYCYDCAAKHGCCPHCGEQYGH